jgi:hypothetical protein
MKILARHGASSAFDEAAAAVQEEGEYDGMNNLCGSLLMVKTRHDRCIEKIGRWGTQFIV